MPACAHAFLAALAKCSRNPPHPRHRTIAPDTSIRVLAGSSEKIQRDLQASSIYVLRTVGDPLSYGSTVREIVRRGDATVLITHFVNEGSASAMDVSSSYFRKAIPRGDVFRTS